MKKLKPSWLKNTITSFGLTMALLATCALVSAADSDFDGLDDSVETNTGVYVSPADTGTNPNSADSDSENGTKCVCPEL